MKREYEYRGFSIHVSAEADFSANLGMGAAFDLRYTATVKVAKVDTFMALLSPLRFEGANGRRFMSTGEALMAGYSAAQRLVDELCDAKVIER